MRFLLLVIACTPSSTDITCPSCPRNVGTSGTSGTTSGGTTGTTVVDLGTSSPDLAPVTCDPLTQMGCPAAQKCQVSGVCADRPAIARGDGSLCGASEMPPVGVDDCSDGELCVLDTLETIDYHECHQPCVKDTDCKLPTRPGGLPSVCVSLPGTNFGTCTNSCDPVGATVGTNGCAAGLACYLVDDFTVCGPPGGGNLGESCGVGNALCAPGLTCITSNGLGCRPLCHLGQGDCASGTCTAFGAAGLGACV